MYNVIETFTHYTKNSMKEEILAKIKTVVGEDYLIINKELAESYLFDAIEENFRPDPNRNSIVAKPKNTKEVSEIVKIASEYNIPIVTRGGATGLCGGCTPTEESIILVLERLNEIYEIDKKNMVAVLGAGVTLMQLLEKLEEYDDLSFPVHPGDEGAQMGGMASTNAGGARAVRHGMMRKHIEGLEVVFADGSIVNIGGKLKKDNAGYDLLQLIIGSEGTLGIITKINLKLYPRDKASATLIVPFSNYIEACEATLDILRSGNIPLAVEYMDKRLFVDTAKMLGIEWQANEGDASLMIVLSEKTKDLLYDTCRNIQNICNNYHCYDILYAEKRQEQEEILLVRSQHWELIKDEVCDSFDLAVPIAVVPEFIKNLKELALEYNTGTNIIAHIADGNVHNDILKVNGKTPEYASELREKMFDLALSMGGTVTGEHGIGKIRIKDLEKQKTKKEIDIMKGIKLVFDPKNILNPNTVVSINSIND